MLVGVNYAADFAIYVGSLWILLTNKVATRTGSSIVLAVIGMGALGNLVTQSSCGATDTMLKIGVACGVGYAFWRVEARHWIRRRAHA